MLESIAAVASDPLQYDNDDLKWATEGRKDSPNRQLFLKYLQPYLATIKSKRALDIGCGLGWLCNEIETMGGSALGLEPSVKNVRLARQLYPKSAFVRGSLQDFKIDEKFDAAFMFMVETFLDIEAAFHKVASLLKDRGQLLMIVSDFERSTRAHDSFRPEIETIGPGEAAIRINSGARFGTICDIVRTIDNYVNAANSAGFVMISHQSIKPDSGHPRFESHKDKVLFHLLIFSKK